MSTEFSPLKWSIAMEDFRDFSQQRFGRKLTKNQMLVAKIGHSQSYAHGAGFDFLCINEDGTYTYQLERNALALTRNPVHGWENPNLGPQEIRTKQMKNGKDKSNAIAVCKHILKKKKEK